MEKTEQFKKQLNENPTLFLDLETGGFNPETDAICSCSIILPNGDNDKTWFIKPYNKNYNEEALKVNNLSKEILEKEGVNLEIFMLEFVEYLEKHFGSYNLGLIQLAGHNISFDIEFLRELFNNENEYVTYIDNITNEVKFYKFKDLFHYHFKDSMILANMMKDLKIIPIKQSISLSELYKYYFGEDELYKNAHSSLTDVVMSLECYAKSLELLNRR